MGLRISNRSGSPIVDLTVRMQLHGGGEQLTPEWSRTHDGELADGGTVSWDQFGGFVPAVPYLRQLNESHPASVSVTFSRMWGPDIMLSAPVQVLAHNEWFNIPVFFDSLAAFVQPNTASVQAVLGEAAELLRANSGDSALCGYQKGSERAALIAAAIYEALRMRRIRYINPPASFEESGQKVRTTSQVLEDRLGTCIDLSVVYAACLEQAGLRPLIWLVDGHALTGFLREDIGLSHSVITEPNAMVNLIESGRAIPLDAVYYEDGAGGDFASAIDRGRKHLQDPAALRGVLVVSRARRDGVRPLPTLDETAPVSPAGLIPVSPAFGSLTLPTELLDSASGDDLVLDTTDSAPERVKRWKRSLLDLSTRNRLLNLRASAEVIDIHVPGTGLALLDDLIHDDVKITLHAHDDLSAIHALQGARRARDMDSETLLKQLDGDHTMYAMVTADKYATQFKGLQRRARTLLEETGNANLYLTLGAMIHTTSSGKEARAPLFLLPVKIIGGTGRSDFRIVVDSANTASPNHCLVEWLRIKHNVQIPDLSSPRLDASGIDIDHALPAIRAALLEHDLDFRIDEIATLSICQFGTFGMWKDLEDSWEVFARSPIVDHLTHRPGESFREPGLSDDSDLSSIALDETEIPVPIQADGSQLRAVALAGAGRTFVLEGPPGTGKSQTITNLIAHTMAQGKSVLFVAEKQAALDVVQRRLDKIGLGDFTLNLHGKNQSPNAIRGQLKQAIDNTARYNQQGWAARRAAYRSLHAPLADYPSKIHAPNGAGQSMWDAYDTLARLGDGPTAPIPIKFTAIDADRAPVQDALRKFERLARSFPRCPRTLGTSPVRLPPRYRMSRSSQPPSDFRRSSS